MITHTIVLTTSLLFGALTPAKVSNVTTNSSAPSKAPSVIYVSKFTVSDTAAKSSESSGGLLANRPHLLGRLRGGDDDSGDDSGILGKRRQEQQDETLDKLPGILQRALVEKLNDSIAPAKAGDGSSHANGWLIQGEFVTIDPGKRGMQAGVGFGAGQSQVEVHARVYTLRDTDDAFLVFDSKGASGHMPGAIMMHNPYVAAAKFVMSKKEPEKEAKKIAKSIAEEIGKFMKAQGIPTKG